MASILPSLRGLVVAGLIASLTIGGLCPCGDAADTHRSPRQASHASHACACVLKTGHCHCGAGCHCGQKLPQKDNDPAVPNSSNDREQMLGLAVEFATASHATVVVFHAQSDLNLLSSSKLTLFAQGTRLNV